MKNKVCVLFLDNLYVLFTKQRVISSESYESDCVHCLPAGVELVTRHLMGDNGLRVDKCRKLVVVVANAVKIFFQPS